ncbi:MAG: hypothetical protein KDB01_14595 [Planctomycetaceae bacterium]|nr:hypothetical protein [Planctomycetaceae bacterium]
MICPGKHLHSVLLGFGCLLIASFAGSSAHAAGEPQTIAWPAGDGFPLQMTYYPALESANPMGLENAPVVILLHGEKGRRLDWDKGSAIGGRETVPQLLQEKGGYAVITVDLRKHGDSVLPNKSDDTVQPNDYLAMVAADLGAMKKYIYEEHQKKNLNMNRLGIVGIDITAPIALAFAEVDWRMVPYDDAALAMDRTPRGQDVRALVLISPQLTAGRVNAAKSLNFLRNPAMGIAFLLIAGEQDTKSAKNAQTLYRSASAVVRPKPVLDDPEAKSEAVQLVTVDAKEAGIPLLVRTPGATLAPMLKFLDDHVKAAPSEWRDRRSRLER